MWVGDFNFAPLHAVVQHEVAKCSSKTGSRINSLVHLKCFLDTIVKSACNTLIQTKRMSGWYKKYTLYVWQRTVLTLNKSAQVNYKVVFHLVSASTAESRCKKLFIFWRLDLHPAGGTNCWELETWNQVVFSLVRPWESLTGLWRFTTPFTFPLCHRIFFTLFCLLFVLSVLLNTCE